MFEHQSDAFRIVPVAFAQQQRRHARAVQLAALEQRLEHAQDRSPPPRGRESLRRWDRHRIQAAAASRPHGALCPPLRRLHSREPAADWDGRSSRTSPCWRWLPHRAERAPFAQMRRIAPDRCADTARSKDASARPIRTGPPFAVAFAASPRQEVAHACFIGTNRSGMDVGSRHVRIPRQDQLRFFQCSGSMRVIARHARGSNERRHGIIERSHRSLQVQRRYVRRELRPALEAVFARNHQLRIGQRHAVRMRFSLAVRESRMMPPHARQRIGIAQPRNRAPDPWPASCIVRGWDGRVILFQAYEAPFVMCLESASIRLKEVSSNCVLQKVGTALSADWMRPSRC